MPVLTDGHATTINFEDFPAVALAIKERSVKPPGYNGGGPNNITSMRTSRLRQMMPKKLMTLTRMTATVFYDPSIYEDLPDIMQVNNLLNVLFSDGAKLDFWGWLEEFEPNEANEGEPPDCDIAVEPSNMDNDQVETNPTYTAAVAP